MREQVLSIDSFNNPLTLEDKYAVATIIIRLILLEPGKIQSHPKMGIGLTTKWRYCDEEELSNLEREIKEQMATYIPQLSVNDVIVYYNNKYLMIQIVLQDNTTYVFTTSDFELVKLVDIL